MNEEFHKYPTDPGVYLMKDRQDTVIYVGKAKNLRARIKQYFAKHRDTRLMIPFLVAGIHTIECIVVQNEKQALLLENTLIKKYHPKYNALLKDDKTFISLYIDTDHPWPMIRLVRCKGKPKGHGLYFGPYPHAHEARATLNLLHKLFPLRQCSNEELKRRTRPCLLYGIKKCIAPCVGFCSQREYMQLVDGAIGFLRGKNQAVLKQLREEMQQASERLEFERAGALLRTIRGIEAISQPDEFIAKLAGRAIDVLAVHREGFDALLVKLIWRDGKLMGSEHYLFTMIANDPSELLVSFILQHYTDELPHELLFSHAVPKSLGDALSELRHSNVKLLFPKWGERKQLVEIAQKNAASLFHQKKSVRDVQEKILIELEESCFLTRYPQTIDCVDTSNIAGSVHVASVVGFVDGIRDPGRTRLFHIREAQAGDDYGALREVLTRRLTKAREESSLPDLIVIDGGQGQLKIAMEVLHELDIASVDTIGFAKEGGRHDQGLSQEQIFLPHRTDPILLDRRSPLLFFLQTIRDTAHRSALLFHRRTRKNKTIKTALQDIPGIGAQKTGRLLKRFGSVAQIQQASDEELLSVKGITQQNILALREKFSRT
jgi:excinuclease ABC subunit C